MALGGSFAVPTFRSVPFCLRREYRPAGEGATMTSDPDHVRDEEVVTVGGEGPADTVSSRDSDSTDTGDATDQADSGDVTDPADAEAALSGPGDTGVMMDAADSGTLDQSDVPTPSGASDTGAMMDSRDTGTLDRTDVGERGDADADESDR
jgi:hypothetical protein